MKSKCPKCDFGYANQMASVSGAGKRCLKCGNEY